MQIGDILLGGLCAVGFSVDALLPPSRHLEWQSFVFFIVSFRIDGSHFLHFIDKILTIINFDLHKLRPRPQKHPVFSFNHESLYLSAILIAMHLLMVQNDRNLQLSVKWLKLNTKSTLSESYLRFIISKQMSQYKALKLSIYTFIAQKKLFYLSSRHLSLSLFRKLCIINE